MNSAASQVAHYGYVLALVSYGALAVFLWATEVSMSAGRQSRRAFLAAIAVSAAWAGTSLLSFQHPGTLSTGLAALTDLVRFGLWFGFLLLPMKSKAGPGASDTLRMLRALALAGLGLSAALHLGTALGGLGYDLSRPLMAASLLLPLCGLLLVEHIYRNLGEDARWNAKPVCLGLGCIFVFDIYLYAEGMLFARFDVDALSLRGAVHALAVPFFYVASRRGSDWVARLQISRTAAFYSITLILAGGYLLFMAAIGYYVRYFGGTWGRALQLSLLIAGFTLLGVLVFSGALRSRLRVFVGKHFYSYRYDYREEWLRFTAMLSSKRSPQEMGEMIVRGLAKMVECPAGSLWTLGDSERGFTQTAHWNSPRNTESESPDSGLCVFLRQQGWVIDLDEFRSSPRRYGTLALPSWLLATPNSWLVVPLLVGEDLLGFVVLSRPVTEIKLNWEVLDLLKTAGRQAAGYLAQMQATEALLEARKFEAFNRMSAFVVHDLKNIVAQLSLMLKNAERLHANREFQQDMLLTVESSLEKMRRLMLQLREGATPPGGGLGVELGPILQRLESSARAQGRKLQVEQSARLSTRGHADRLERVLGHLVQNAFDATPPEGRVWIEAKRHSGQVMVEVGDTGSGMSEEFVRDQLFRPFNSTKHSGMGIGTYESSQYIRELGGSLSVASRTGEGTRITVLLPLFEVSHGSDLSPIDPPP